MSAMYFCDRCPKILVSELLFYLSLTLAQNTAPQTLSSLSIFSSQKPCAQSCFIVNDFGCLIDNIGIAVGCVPDGGCQRAAASNNCYCRTDLQSVAESYLTSCVQNSCTVGDSSIDMSSAGSIYNYYCSSQGFPVNVLATTTQEGTQATATMYVLYLLPIGSTPVDWPIPRWGRFGSAFLPFGTYPKCLACIP